MTLVLRSDRSGVTTLTLNRPEKLNALGNELLGQLKNHLGDVASDPSVRCVVLTGAGRSFCAGHDLSEVTGSKAVAAADIGPDTIDALESLPQPTIAKIRGHCLTGGLELALGCDLLIAGSSAQLGDTHGKWGLAPIWGMTVRLPERIGKGPAKMMMFTSRRVGAQEALAMRLVDAVADDEQLDAVVDELTQSIVANSDGTNRIVKRLLLDGQERTRRQALDHERSLPYGLPSDMRERIRSARPK